MKRPRKQSEEAEPEGEERLERRLKQMDQKLDHIIYRLWEEDPRTARHRKSATHGREYQASNSDRNALNRKRYSWR